MQAGPGENGATLTERRGCWALRFLDADKEEVSVTDKGN